MNKAVLKPDFELFETFRYDPSGGFQRLDLHLQRMEQSSAALGFVFNATSLRKQLETFENSDQALRVRLSLAADGIATITTAAYQPLPPATVWKLAIAQTSLSSTDPLLRHKTTRRKHYETARAEFSTAEADEVLLINERQELCEGTITSLFLDMGDGILRTPSLECGLLDGVFRRELLEQGIAAATIITAQDLYHARHVFVGNALRGMITAQLIKAH